MTTSTVRADVYTRVTPKIVADLEKRVRTWMKPWSRDVDSARVALPLRHNGVPYRGIDILLLWSDALDKEYRAPSWMAYPRRTASRQGRRFRGSHSSNAPKRSLRRRERSSVGRAAV